MVSGLGKFPPDTSEDSLKSSNSQNMKKKISEKSSKLIQSSNSSNIRKTFFEKIQ